MFSSRNALLAALAAAGTVMATMCPTPSSAKRGLADPAFTIPMDELTAQLNCTNPGGIYAVKNPFLLVPGTGTNGTQTWEHGYRKLLGHDDGGLGYDVCYVSPPPYMLDDIQNTTQYIANAIDLLNQVTCRPLPVMGWDLGGLATQFTFTFYPSTRRKVSHFFGLAADFRGTTAISIPDPLPANVTVAPSIWQQAGSSELLRVLAQKGGNYNWVPTTSLFSRPDGFVLPQDNSTMEGSTSVIGGTRAGNILVQDFCPNVTVAHSEWLWDNFGFQVVKIALDSQMRFASPAAVRTAVAKGDIVCKQADVAPGLTEMDVQILNMTEPLALALIANPPVNATAEPIIRPYILDAPDNPVHD